MNKRIFVDMDGVLATFHPDKSIEEISEPGYFRNLEPQENVVDAINKLIKTSHEVFILTAVLNDNAKEEKIEWLKEYMPCMNSDKVICVPYGTNKTEYVMRRTGRLEDDDILVDDFTYNLKNWHGKGVKLLNKINNTNRSWTGYVVNGNGDSETIYTSLIGIGFVA